MTDHILATLKREHTRLAARIKVLAALMTAKHITSEDAKAMDALYASFNAAKTAEDRLRIAENGIPLEKRFNEAVKREKHQAENYMKWLEEKSELESASYQLQSEISNREYYAKRASA